MTDGMYLALCLFVTATNYIRSIQKYFSIFFFFKYKTGSHSHALLCARRWLQSTTKNQQHIRTLGSCTPSDCVVLTRAAEPSRGLPELILRVKTSAFV